MDINKNRLDKTLKVLKPFQKRWVSLHQFTTHMNRREALKDADFVQTTIQVGGYNPQLLSILKYLVNLA